MMDQNLAKRKGRPGRRRAESAHEGPLPRHTLLAAILAMLCLTADFSPAFSAEGKVLFILSTRGFTQAFSSFEFS